MVRVVVNTIYSIGYSGFSIDDFLAALKKHNVAAVIDVRSRPFSSYFSNYDKGALEPVLKKRGVFYRNYAREFGAQQDDRRYYSAEGYLDFERFAKARPFLEGVDKLRAGMERDYTFALMCAEKRPIDCHRAILVSHAFFDLGYNVIHLMPNGEMVTQAELNGQLLEKYYPDRNQLTLFDEPTDDASLLKLAYRRRNAEIGHRMTEENE